MAGKGRAAEKEPAAAAARSQHPDLCVHAATSHHSSSPGPLPPPVESPRSPAATALRMASSSPSSQQQDDASARLPRTAAFPLLDLPHELLAQRIVAHTALDAAARLALFRSSHALAKMVLQHAHGSKRLSVLVVGTEQPWPATLAHLLGTVWQPLAVPGGLELQITLYLPRPPPAVSQHISRLHFRRSSISFPLLTWRLHDAGLWARLQHLTFTDCPLIVPTIGGGLQPIPQLISFTWSGAALDWYDQASLLALLPLVERATCLHLDLRRVSSMDRHRGHAAVLQRMQRITHVRLEGPINADEIDLLLRLPELQHVTLRLPRINADFGRQPCQWRTLTVLSGALMDMLALLPRALRGLEQLTIHDALDISRRSEDEDQQSPAAMGMALLQHLHDEGRRLVLEPQRETGLLQWWGLRADDAFIGLRGPSHYMRDMFRLALEAGRGVTTLEVDARYGRLPLQLLQEEVAPLLQRHAGGVSMLCVHPPPEDEWCRGVLGALPDCVARVAVALHDVGERGARALVQGGVVSLRHPLTLTLIHSREDGALEAELRQLAQQSQHLSLELTRR